jgi:SAM-dependent methyltransferase
MRIISIGTGAVPSSPAPAAAAPEAPPAVAPREEHDDDAGWDADEPATSEPTTIPRGVALPPQPAPSARPVSKPPPPPATPKPPPPPGSADAAPLSTPVVAKPPAIEEVEAIEEADEPVAEAAPHGARTDEIEPIPDDEVEEHAADSGPGEARADEGESITVDVEDHAAEAAPRGARTDEIEPLPDDEDAADRISEVEIAATGDEDLEAPKPKKPPPPPPKRPISTEIPVTADPAEAKPAAPPPAGPVSSPAPVQTVDLAGKKRQKPWWEEIFSDDYIRTMKRIEPKFVRKECNFIEERLGLEKGAIMLDLACGAGMHAVELASRGYNVVGYDLSLAMLAHAQDEAQERGQKINFLQGDMREMAFEEAFDGVYSWSTSFGYFDDEKNLNVLSRIHRALRQGGMLLLDVANRDYICPRQPSLVWFEGEGCVCMDEMHVDFFSSRLRVKRTVMFEDGRSRECDYSIRLYGLHELGRMLHDTGFKVVEVTGHMAHPGVFFGSESPRIIVLAERG